MLAVRLAQSRGYTDGVYLNQNGDVVETGSANIVILKNERFITPSLESGCLPGITRHILIKHFDISEELFAWEEMLDSDAIFLCSSIRLLIPVCKVEDKLFESNPMGEKLIGDLNQLIRSKIDL
jgi:branched-subunit amino acid aminotransferase/4-amino-4-deoxychorismate lyase